MTKYKIQYYYDKIRFLNAKKKGYIDFKLKIDEELDLLDKIIQNYRPDFEMIFENLSFYRDNTPYDEEYEQFYLNNIVLAGNHSRVKVAKLFKTNTGNNKIESFLLIYRDESPIMIYPHLIGDSIEEIKDGLKKILTHGFEKHKISSEIDKKSDSFKFTETDLQKLISSYPELVESGIKLKGLEVPVKNGLIDAVFIDENGRYLICEMKLDFTDQVIGQVIRYANTFRDEFNIDNIRMGIITLERSEERIKACKNSDIEVFILNFEKN